MEEKIEILINKNKMILLTILPVTLLGLLGIWLVLDADNFQYHPNDILDNPTRVKVVGILNILIGAIWIGVLIKNLLKKVGLTISKRGITDNSTLTSIGLIEWNDITDIAIKQIMFTKVLCVYTTTPEKYINKSKNKIQEKLMRNAIKNYGTPIAINLNSLKYDCYELEKLVKKELMKNKNIG